MKTNRILFLLLLTAGPLSAPRFWNAKKAAPSGSTKSSRKIVPYGTAEDRVGDFTTYHPRTTTAAHPPQPPIASRQAYISEDSSTDYTPKPSHATPRSALPSSYKITPRPATPPPSPEKAVALSHTRKQATRSQARAIEDVFANLHAQKSSFPDRDRAAFTRRVDRAQAWANQRQELLAKAKTPEDFKELAKTAGILTQNLSKIKETFGKNRTTLPSGITETISALKKEYIDHNARAKTINNRWRDMAFGADDAE